MQGTNTRWTMEVVKPRPRTSRDEGGGNILRSTEPTKCWPPPKLHGSFSLSAGHCQVFTSILGAFFPENGPGGLYHSLSGSFPLPQFQVLSFVFIIYNFQLETSFIDWSRGVLVGVGGSAGDLDLSQADHREANEVGHLELMDKLSVAAGVTAKDKRSKNKANMAYHTRLAKKGE